MAHRFSITYRKGFVPAVVIFFLMGITILGIGMYMFDQRSAQPQQSATPSGIVVGGDKDSHGCIGSAGYTWCQAKNQCIRSWEQYCTAAQSKTVTFACDAGKTIKATFYPTDDKFVDLVLSDGRNMSVPHAVSASGARYAKSDESFVFWNKGDTAFVTEGASSTETYANCILKTN